MQLYNRVTLRLKFKLLKLKTFLVLLLLIGAKLSAQDTLTFAVDTTGTSVWRDLAYDGGSILRGVGQFYIAPSKWKKKDVAVAAGVLAGTAIVWSADEPINDYFTNQNAGVPKYAKDGGYYFGKPLYNYGLTLGIYSFGLFTHNEKVRRTGVLIISSATAAGILQTVLKNGVGRARPSAGRGSGTFEPFSNEESYHSFPSGHAILSFTTAYAISKQFKSPWVKGGIWALGMITPVSRMWAGAHWASDITAGVAISVITVEFMDRYLNTKRYAPIDPSAKKISWNLNLSRQTIGVIGTF